MNILKLTDVHKQHILGENSMSMHRSQLEDPKSSLHSSNCSMLPIARPRDF